MNKLKPKPHQFWAWCSTLTILAGAITGFYPLYCFGIFHLSNWINKFIFCIVIYFLLAIADWQ